VSLPALGTSTTPFNSVADGVNAAASSGRDIVLVRTGNYNEQLTLSEPVTLRAIRVGPTIIGIS